MPKKVGCLDCWVYELVDRAPHIFCGVEFLVEGEYHKYHNWDWVNQSVDRNTSSAFSHFTYEASQSRILICDLQGAGDLYTDPQMHTSDGKCCGKGNMGQRGIDKFLSAHKCSAICTYLKLPSANRACSSRALCHSSATWTTTTSSRCPSPADSTRCPNSSK